MEYERRIGCLKISTKNDKKLQVIENKFERPSEEYRMQLSPYTDKEQNNRMVILGPSGCGKSTFACNYIKEYKKMNRKNDVYLFSRHNEDPSIDSAEPLRVCIDESEIVESKKMMEPVVESKMFEKSLVIFDDINSSESRVLTRFWHDLASDMSENGRKLHIDIVFILHNTNGWLTRMIMSESTYYVLFLNSGSKAMYTRILKQYLCIENKATLERLFRLPTRWIVFSNIAPLFIMTENQVQLLKDFE